MRASGFLSTPSARRATTRQAGLMQKATYFYPRPPRGGRPNQYKQVIQTVSIFLSTPSARRATLVGLRVHRGGQISIHALREEGDQALPHVDIAQSISIHALREEGDRPPSRIWLWSWSFLSTPSARRATVILDRDDLTIRISIHALREEGDNKRKDYGR